MSGGDSGLVATRPAHEKKLDYFKKLISYFDKYSSCFVVSADNIGSAHLQEIRRHLRAKDGVILMGKNTQIRKAIRSQLASNPKLEQLLPFVKNNIGFVFCKGDLAGVKKIVTDNKKPAPAKIGSLAPNDVIVPAGNTGLEPTQTGFLQALNIASKITRGQIEILKDVVLLKTGDKVGSSEAALLEKLKIAPFAYGLQIIAVYDQGAIVPASVLDITDNDVLSRFSAGVAAVASLSLGAHFPTTASVPHSLANGYKAVMAVAIATGYTYDQVKDLKELLNDPEKMKKLAAAAAAPVAAAPKKEEKKQEKVKEKEPEPVEEDVGMGGLFD